MKKKDLHFRHFHFRKSVSVLGNVVLKRVTFRKSTDSRFAARN